MYTIEEYRFAASLDEAAELLKKSKRNVILAGGTWLRMGAKQIGTAIDLTRLGLDKIEVTADEVTIGAMTTLRRIETNALLREGYAALSDCVRSIVGVQFRNCATIGAGVYSRYGFSDVLTALLAYDAEVTLHGAGRMTLEAFLSNRPKRDILTHIHLPRGGKKGVYRSLRRSKTDLGVIDLCLTQGEDGYAVSVGARPGPALRCRAAEEMLDRGDITAACEAVKALPYGTNSRASGAYRRDMAAVLLRRAYEEIRKEASK